MPPPLKVGLIAVAIVTALTAAAGANEQVAQSAGGMAAVTLPEIVVHPRNPPHFTVPAGYDADAALHPYTSGLGPCPEGASPAQGCRHPTGNPIPPSRYERAPFNR